MQLAEKWGYQSGGDDLGASPSCVKRHNGLHAPALAYRWNSQTPKKINL
jgi:hypothetical protein